MLGRPILQNVNFQDVVFANGRSKCLHAHDAALRASVDKLSHLDPVAKKKEKCDLSAVRKGCFLEDIHRTKHRTPKRDCGHDMWLTSMAHMIMTSRSD